MQLCTVFLLMMFHVQLQRNPTIEHDSPAAGHDTTAARKVREVEYELQAAKEQAEQVGQRRAAPQQSITLCILHAVWQCAPAR